MTQALYAHMNNKTIKKNKKKRRGVVIMKEVSDNLSTEKILKK
jgi:hypothetical protein